MYSEEVLQLARFWLRKCLSQEHEKCPDENFNNPGNRYWPTRLIELPPHDPTAYDINIGKMEKVRLVAGQNAAKLATEEEAYRFINMALKDHQPRRLGSLPRAGTIATPEQFDVKAKKNIWQYVTLSHCWGKQEIPRLLDSNKGDFERGIPLKELPPTFRDAIEFARRLDRKVRYIWVDSLCIVQDNKDDWARESAQMYNVYRYSYCNISATAASNSHQGIYNKAERNPQLLWEDEINLNIDGIPRSRSPKKTNHEIGLEVPIRRCTIRDLSFWERKVDDASVNKRAWVLQERLLAPRVLHFCEDQIAWECSHLDAAESLPHGVSNMELKFGEVKERVRLKSLVPEDFGSKPIEIDALRSSDVTHEDWKRIVERYSTTRLTLAKDKLIALAGIAEIMATRISGLYVAGLWERYLASQLLWRVNPVYAQSHEVDNTYEDPREEDEKSSGPVPCHINNKSKRPKSYRSPSFSWAAIDAPQGVELGT
jgi:Heterokaryon incompatibility protein (HET)